MTPTPRSSADIRAELDHPVIDADGHWTELFPVFFKYIDEIAGAAQQELTDRDIDSDEFAAVDIGSEDDVRRLLSATSYFGCEAHDPMTSLADERLNLKLKPLFGSDISHFDVTDCSETVEEAWELVDEKMITERDFRQFTFTNAVHLYKKMNPDFFTGTVVASAADAEFDPSRG